MSADPTPESDADDAPLDVPVEVEAPSSPEPQIAHEVAPDRIADSPLAERLAQVEAALAKAEQEKKDNWDKFLRAAADLENHRRRSKRDLEDARAESRTRVLKEMLPVVDNMERGLAHAEESAKAADLVAIVDGIRLVLRQFLTAFERVDVTPVEAAGQAFDPNLHEAISQQETDASPPGTVVQVLQRGYKLGDRLLRPALVVVAKAPPPPPPPTDGEGSS